MPNAEKVQKVATLKERIEGAEALLFVDYRGLSVAEATEARSQLAEAGARLSVVKNTLMRRAADEAGLEVGDLLEGPTGVAFVFGDPVSAAKKIVEASKRFPALALKGGWVEGRALTGDQAKQLAALESRAAMLAKAVGLVKGELTRAATAFQALQSRFLGLAEALRDKRANEGSQNAEPAAELSAAGVEHGSDSTAFPAGDEQRGQDEQDGRDEVNEGKE